jgi:uncharacterized membrane protein
MTTVAFYPSTGRLAALRTARGRVRASLPSLLGLIAIGALLPLRGTWLADLLLVGLSLSVPGILALRALGVPAAAVIAYPIYIPAAALLVLMTAGTSADLIGPIVGIARPLHGDTTALAALGLGFVLWLLGIRRDSTAGFPWRELLDRPMLLAPLALPLLAGAGALMLNNGEGPLAARLAAILTAASLLFCLLRAGRLGRAQVAMLLFGCALAAEWAFSLRSQEIIGFDIATELHIAQQTQTLGVWYLGHHNDPYGAMLSLTILPSILASLTGCTPLIAFKVLYPVLAAMIPASIFLVSERVMRPGFAAGAAALLIAQSYFFQLLPEIARQEIGMLFFAALIAALFDTGLTRYSRLRLLSALAVGLVVSHYSSTYLAIPAVLIALVGHAILGRVRRIPWLSQGLLCVALVLTGGAAIWDGAITNSASNVGSLSSSLQSSGLNLLPHRTGSVVTTYLNGDVVTGVNGPTFEQMAVNDYRGRSGYIHPLAAARQNRFLLASTTVPTSTVRIPILATLLRRLWTIVGQLILVFGTLGAVAMSLRRRSPEFVRKIGVLALSTVVLLAVIRFSGTVAVAYNQTRALLQSLILLAIPAAWLAEHGVDRLRRRRGRWPARVAAGGMAIAVSLVFAYQSGVSALLSGGPTSLNLSQRGEDFERLYMTRAELTAAAWASAESENQLLYADRYGQLRLSLSTGRVAFTDLTPPTIDRDAWIYGTRTNIILGRARGQIANTAALYRWPSAFLDSYFNSVYANNDSRVYHR